MLKTVLRVNDLSKKYNHSSILNHVQMDLHEGEILGLLGGTAMGKTTLCRVLSGEYGDYQGSIILDGVERHWKSVLDARRNGVFYIGKQSQLIDEMSIAKNLFLIKDDSIPVRPGCMYENKSNLSLVSNRYLYHITEALLMEWGVSLSPNLKIKKLSFAQRHVIEILRAVICNARVLILDEVTSYYNSEDYAFLKGFLKEVAEHNISVIFTDFKLYPMMEVCDRISVIKKGRFLGNILKDEFSEGLFKKLLLAEYDEKLSLNQRTIQGTEKGICHVKVNDRHEEITVLNFHLMRGEIIGVTGNDLNKMNLIANSICGYDVSDMYAEIELENSCFRVSSPKNAMRQGVYGVFSCLDEFCLFKNKSISYNLLMMKLNMAKKKWIMIPSNFWTYGLKEYAIQYGMESFLKKKDVQELDANERVKLYMARWLVLKPKLLVLFCVTDELDLVQREIVNRMIRDACEKGTTVIWFAACGETLSDICNRIITV